MQREYSVLSYEIIGNGGIQNQAAIVHCVGYLPLARFFRRATCERAPRWLWLKTEPNFASQKMSSRAPLPPTKKAHPKVRFMLVANYVGYSPLARFFRRATCERAPRWLWLKTEPNFASQKMSSRAPLPPTKKAHPKVRFTLAEAVGFEPTVP